jgi:hypothetical protein
MSKVSYWPKAGLEATPVLEIIANVKYWVIYISKMTAFAPPPPFLWRLKSMAPKQWQKVAAEN